jgi:hypothetical protein
MSINFFDESCQTKTNQSKFGLCDDSSLPNTPAYIDIDGEHPTYAVSICT